jgi:hypothetical protein
MLCILSLVLWVRSYRWIERLDGPLGRFYPGRTVAAVSIDGLVLIGVQPEQYNRYAADNYAFRFNRSPFDHPMAEGLERGVLGFKRIRGPNERGVQIPWWSLFCLTLVGGALPWLFARRQFSLRTLLALMTAVAAALGVITLVP